MHFASGIIAMWEKSFRHVVQLEVAGAR